MSLCRPTWAFFLLAALVAGPMGCGPSTARLSGMVSCGDKALVLGTVNLLSEDGRPYQGQIGADGRYAVEALPWGKYRVMIHSPDPLPPASAPPRKDPPPEIAAKQKEKEELRARWISIPEKYSDFERSELSVDVNKSVVVHDIQLEKPKMQD